MIRSSFFLLLLILTACLPQGASVGGSSDSSATLEICPDTILIEDFAFKPAACKVKVGTTVVFKNLDVMPHTATALFNAPVAFDTTELVQNASATIRFDTVANIPYHCEIHPSMAGTILVEP